MQSSTSVRVSASTRDALRSLADADDLTLDQEIARLARAERQRRMGVELSQKAVTEGDQRWIDAGIDSVNDALR